MEADLKRPSAGRWTRRQFVRLSAGGAAAAPMHRLFASFHRPAMTGFAYATAIAEDGSGSIHVYAVDGEHWTPLAPLPSEAPSFSCLSADGKTLYIANELNEVAGLPRGAVTAYRIAGDGRPELLGQKPLSLAAIRPKHLALSPDGSTLAVAASGGGIYNLISIQADGSLGSIKAIRKETGSGPRSEQTASHPHTLLFDKQNGGLFASDLGSDRLSLFDVGDDNLLRRQLLAMEDGSGPGALALGGSALYVRNSLNGRLDVYDYDAGHGKLRGKIQSIGLNAGNGGSLALHPSGHTLYLSGTHLGAWSVGSKGQLTRSWSFEGVAADQLVSAFDGRVLYAVHGESGSIRQINLDEQTGALLKAQDVMRACGRWTSLAVLPA